MKNSELTSGTIVKITLFDGFYCYTLDGGQYWFSNSLDYNLGEFIVVESIMGMLKITRGAA